MYQFLRMRKKFLKLFLKFFYFPEALPDLPLRQPYRAPKTPPRSKKAKPAPPKSLRRRGLLNSKILPEFFFHFGYDTALYTRDLHLRHADHLGDFALRHVAEVP